MLAVIDAGAGTGASADDGNGSSCARDLNMCTQDRNNSCGGGRGWCLDGADEVGRAPGCLCYKGFEGDDCEEVDYIDEYVCTGCGFRDVVPVMQCHVVLVDTQSVCVCACAVCRSSRSWSWWWSWLWWPSPRPHARMRVFVYVVRYDCGYKCTFNRGTCAVARTSDDGVHRYFECTCSEGYAGRKCGIAQCKDHCNWNGEVGSSACAAALLHACRTPCRRAAVACFQRKNAGLGGSACLATLFAGQNSGFPIHLVCNINVVWFITLPPACIRLPPTCLCGPHSASTRTFAAATRVSRAAFASWTVDAVDTASATRPSPAARPCHATDHACATTGGNGTPSVVRASGRATAASPPPPQSAPDRGRAPAQPGVATTARASTERANAGPASTATHASCSTRRGSPTVVRRLA